MTEEEIKELDNKHLISKYAGLKAAREIDYDTLYLVETEMLERMNAANKLKREEKRLEYLWCHPNWVPEMDGHLDFRTVIDQEIFMENRNANRQTEC